MSPRAFSWLEAKIRPPTNLRERVLVIAATSATLRLVRLWAVDRGGLGGVEAHTPATLARVLLGNSDAEVELEKPTPLPPPDTLAGQRIGNRPGVANVARNWLKLARRMLAATALDLPLWLEELAATGWARTADEEALAAWIEWTHLEPDWYKSRWERVVYLGFERPGSATWVPISKVTAQLSTITAVRVPDVIAAARRAVVEIVNEPDCLVLVSESATASRLSTELRLQGIPSSPRATVCIRTHPLALAARTLLPVFSNPQESISSGDLVNLFALWLGQFDQAAYRGWLDAMEHAPVQVDSHTLTNLFEQLYLKSATVEQFIVAVRRSQHPAALWTLARLLTLEQAIAGYGIEQALSIQSGEIEEDDDFDSLLADLLGEENPVFTYTPQTIGCLYRFIVDSRPCIEHDKVARAVIGALRDASDWPANVGALTSALSASVREGGLGGGVQILAVDEYDGRPTKLLLLLDAHNRGIFSVSGADALLSEDVAISLGAPFGKQLLSSRNQTAMWAYENAENTLAIVSGQDASGRMVVAPQHFTFLSQETTPLGAHLPLLTTKNIRRLQVVPGGDANEGGPWSGEEVCRQAMLEWWREGSYEASEAANQKGAPLHQVLQTATTPPPHLAPWLGFAGALASLGSGPFSVSGLFDPLCKCMYRGFVEQKLKARHLPKEASEVDPRVMGLVIHQSLERATQVVKWNSGSVEAQTDQAMQNLASKLDPTHGRLLLSEAKRWRAHWRVYFQSRNKNNLYQRKQPYRFMMGRASVKAAQAQLLALVPQTTQWQTWQQKHWLTAMARPGAALNRSSFVARPMKYLPDGSSFVTELTRFFQTEAFVTLQKDVAQTSSVMEIEGLTPLVQIIELGFGGLEEPGVAVHLPSQASSPIAIEKATLMLHRPIAVVGRIDRIDVFRHHDEFHLRVIDYKTGGYGDVQLDFDDLSAPQLPIYGLIVEDNKQQLPNKLSNSRVVMIELDRLKDTHTNDRLCAPFTIRVFDESEQERVRHSLKELVKRADDGIYPLRPLSQHCGALNVYAHCPWSSVCRLSGLPSGET